MKRLIFALAMITIILCVSGLPLPELNIDLSQTTVSGLSSGAQMATQMHFAHSADIKAAAIYAGGPYFCAQGQMTQALTSCMTSPLAINIDLLLLEAKKFAQKGEIDPLENLKDQKVYMFSGKKDSVVYQGVMQKSKTMYEKLGAKVTTSFDLEAEHCFPTVSYGNKCGFKGEPQINKCNQDGAWKGLSAIQDNLKEPVAAIHENLVKFDQSPQGKPGYSMHQLGQLQVPTACQKQEACRLHIAFHGCEQTIEDIGTDQAENTGINAVAEANNIVVLYPQTKKSPLTPQNPKGCWDWWDYVETNSKKYTTKKGKQIEAVWRMALTLAGQL